MPLIAFGLLSLLLIPHIVHAQWPTIEVAQTRFSGICAEQGQFDCGVLGEHKCIPMAEVHNGKPNCPDQSDEFCFPGQIRCGAFCANLEHLTDCLTNPRCESELDFKPSPDSQFVEASFCPYLKRKLCVLPNAVPCKGYGECVLRKWLMDGQKNCFDGSDEEPQYAAIFQLSDHPGHHILPHIISTGGSAAVFPFGAPQQPPPEVVTQTTHALPTQPPLPPTAIAGPVDHPSTTHSSHPHEHQTHGHQEHTTPHSTHHSPSTSFETLYPHQPIPTRATTREHSEGGGPDGGGTLYPNQPTTRKETLYPTPRSTTTTPLPTSPTPTWWPFGRETFETTKEYVDKLDEFGETYGPATRPWTSGAQATPPTPSFNRPMGGYPFVPVETGGGGGYERGSPFEHPSRTTTEDWLVFGPQGSPATDPPGITVDLPASPDGENAWLQPWWKQATRPPVDGGSHSATLYPGQRPNRPPIVQPPEQPTGPPYSPLRPPHRTPPPPPTESDREPFVVPGGKILVWPNGTLTGPAFTPQPPAEVVTSTHLPPTQISPFQPQPFIPPVPFPVPNLQHQTTHGLPPLQPVAAHTPPNVPVSTLPPLQLSTLPPFPPNGFWPIAPAQVWPILLPEDAEMAETPILIPPTYMPVVSTYAPAETIGPGPPTLLPIYPSEIGQNVKITTPSGGISAKPHHSTVHPHTESSATPEGGEEATGSTGGGHETTTPAGGEHHANRTETIEHSTHEMESNQTTLPPSYQSTPSMPLPVQTTIGGYEGEETTEEMSTVEMSTTTGSGAERSTTWNESAPIESTTRMGDKTSGMTAEFTTKEGELSTAGGTSEGHSDFTTGISEHSTSEGVSELTTEGPINGTSRPSVEEWAPALIGGGLGVASALAEGKKRNASCAAIIRKTAHDLVQRVDCECPPGQMLNRKEKCERAPVATFFVNLHQICNRSFDGAPIEAAELAVFKVAASGAAGSACVRQRAPHGDSSAVLLNAVCPTSDCSLNELRAHLERRQHDLPEVEIEIAADEEGACADASLNDCGPDSKCETRGLLYVCHCKDPQADVNGDGRDCSGGATGCTRVLGICLLIWLVILLLALCIGPLVIGYVCYRCGCLQQTPCWSKVRESSFFRKKRQDLESGLPAGRPGSPTQQRHNEGLPRPPDSTLIPISSSRLPDIPHLTTKESEDAGGPDYYNTGNDDEYETDSASHGLVSLISTEQSGTDREPTEGEGDTTAKSVAAEVHRDLGTADSKRAAADSRGGVAEAGPSNLQPDDAQAGQQKGAAGDRRGSTASRAGTPTIWEKFKILGDQYAQPKDRRSSESTSLDSLIRRYQEQELQKLRERNPELFVEQQPAAVFPAVSSAAITASSTAQAIPYLVQTPIPPTPQPSTSGTYGFANQPLPGSKDVDYDPNYAHFLSERQAGGNELPSTSNASSTSALSAPDSSVTPIPIRDAIEMAEALNRDYKLQSHRFAANEDDEEDETSTSGRDESLSTIPHTPNSDELFHYPQIEGGDFDYTAEADDLEDEEQGEAVEQKPGTGKRSIKTADSMRARQRQSSHGRLQQSTDESSDPAVELMEAVAAGRPLPPHMRLSMPVDSPNHARPQMVPSTSGFTGGGPGARRNPNERPVVRGRLQDTPPPQRGASVAGTRQPKPPIPAAARRSTAQATTGVNRLAQKPPRAPVPGVSGLIKPPPAGAAPRRGAPRPTSPTPGLRKKTAGSRTSTMSSQQKLALATAPSTAGGVANPARRALPLSERQRKRSSLPMGDIAPKRSPSLPSIDAEGKRKKVGQVRRSLDAATSLEQLKKADFMIADIDLDLPGPHMVPASLDDIRSGRLSELVAGVSDDKAIDAIAARTAADVTKSALRSQSNVVSVQQTTRTTTLTAAPKGAPRPLDDSDLDDSVAARERLPPLAAGSSNANGKVRKRGGVVNGGGSSVLTSGSAEVPPPFAQPLPTASLEGTPRTRRNIEDRVHDACLTDRPPWDSTPLKAGDLEKIPLDWNLARSHSLGNFDSIGLGRRRGGKQQRSRSFAQAQSARSEKRSGRPQREPSSVRSQASQRKVGDRTSIGPPPPADSTGDLRKRWVDELRTSLNSKKWLDYD